MVSVTDSSRPSQPRISSDARLARNEVIGKWTASDVQRRAVDAVSKMAAHWLRDRTSPEDVAGYFPADMVWISLAPLLESLTESACWHLIDSEGVRSVSGPPVIGHIIASNTPLLPMTSVIRALLVGSASIVKMPANSSDGWLEMFLRTLRQADPEIASLVQICRWPRTDTVQNSWLQGAVDLMVVYGSNATVDAVQAGATTPVLEYGHKVSTAIISKEGASHADYDGLALDILMYDQSGCLSPRTVFVEGNLHQAKLVGQSLAAAMAACRLPDPVDTPDRAARISEYLSLTNMNPESEILHTCRSRFSVILRNECRLHASPGHGIINVLPGTKEGIIQVLTKSESLIQGVALAAEVIEMRGSWIAKLSSAGIFNNFRAGTLQKPTIAWRENGYDVLRSLVG